MKNIRKMEEGINMNLKKLTLGTLLLSTIVLTGVQTETLAEEVAKRDTDAQVKFKPSEGPVKPVDPTDPEKPVDPTDPVDPEKPIDLGTNGPLSLDYASSLNFGENEISTQNKVYNASAQLITGVSEDGKQEVKHVPLYAQVTDNRGTLAGWNLSVKQNGQLKASSNSSELQGAEISFKDVWVNSVSQSKEPSDVKKSFTLNPNGEIQKVTASSKNEGGGTWVTAFGKEENIKDEENRTVTESVQLSVPGKSEKLSDTYATTLTWILTDEPGNIQE